MTIRTFLGVIGVSGIFLFSFAMPVMAVPGATVCSDGMTAGNGGLLDFTSSQLDCNAKCSKTSKPSLKTQKDTTDATTKITTRCITNHYYTSGTYDTGGYRGVPGGTLQNKNVECCCTGDTPGTSCKPISNTTPRLDIPKSFVAECGDDVGTPTEQIKYNICVAAQKYAGYGNVPIGAFVGSIINILLGILGIIFLVLLVAAGFKWVTSEGDEKKISQALATINQSLIGLLITGSAYVITVYVINAIQKAAGIPGT